jgi:hypothetical protein
MINLDTNLVTFHNSLFNLTALKESLVLQKINLNSSKEYLRLKQIYYRAAKKLGKTPSLISEKKKMFSQTEKQLYFKDLRTRILDLKQKLVSEGVQLKLSPDYYKLKTEFYRLGRNLGLKATLKLSVMEIKEYSKPSFDEEDKNFRIRGYLDLKDRVARLKASLKIKGVLLNSSLEYSSLRRALFRMTGKVGFRPTSNAKKLPDQSAIFGKAPYFTKSLSTQGIIAHTENYDADAEMAAFAAKQKDDLIELKSDLSDICWEHFGVKENDEGSYEGDHEKEVVQLPVLSDSAQVNEKPLENTLLTGSSQISYENFSKQQHLWPFDRFDFVTMRIRSDYIRSDGFHSVDFNSHQRKTVREAAFEHFYKCERRDFRVENLLESDIFNDCIAGGSDQSSSAYAFFMKNYMAKATELDSARLALSLSSKSLKKKRLFDELNKSFSHMGQKLETLARAERIMFDQLMLAKNELELLNLAKLEGRPLPFYFED